MEAKLTKEKAWPSSLSNCSEKLSMIASRIIDMCHLHASVDVPGKEAEWRPAEDLQVQPQRPAVDVGQVRGHPLLHLVQGLGLAPVPVDLRQPGDARLDAMPGHVGLDALAVVEVVQHRMGARTHQGHVAAQDV